MPSGIYKHKKGKESSNWRGGRYLSINGYWMIHMPGHPRADNRDYAYEHVVDAEKALGKLLPKGAEIHHYGAKTDNTKIVICENHAYHMLLHRRMRALEACGHADWHKCRYCKKYDKPENLYISGGRAYHRACYNRAKRERYKNNKLKGGNI